MNSFGIYKKVQRLGRGRKIKVVDDWQIMFYREI